MATLSFEDGALTSGLPARCAFLMRVSRSAMGSVMLTWLPSPARLAQPGNVAAIGLLAQLGARQAELAVDTARAARDRAAVALANRVGIARQRLQLRLRGETLLDSGLRV